VLPEAVAVVWTPFQSAVSGVHGVFDAAMSTMGLNVQLPNLGVQETFDRVGSAILNVGGSFSSRIQGWVRTRLNGNGQPVGALQVPPMPMAQPNNDNDDEESEVSTLLGDDFTTAARTQLDGMLVAALFAGGACFGAALTREEEDALRRERRSLPIA
jgi:hypothetical protein